MQYQVSHPALEPLRAAHEKADRRYIEDLQSFLRGWPERYRTRQFSLSTLQRSPKQRILGNEARKTAVVNPANQLWSLMGTHIHAMLEEYPHGIRERRLGFIIPELDVLVHHQPDWLNNGIYVDYKNVSTTSMKYSKEHWEEQFNFGAWLFEHGEWIETVESKDSFGISHKDYSRWPSHYPSPLKVDQIFACVQLLDWRPNNPQTLAVSSEGSMVIEFPKWTSEKVLKWATDRARIHLEAQEAYGATQNQQSLPACSKDDQWEKEPGYKVYALTKKGELSKVAATSEMFESEAIALKWANDNDKGKVTIKQIPGYPHMCTTYCEARSICQQGLARVVELQSQ